MNILNYELIIKRHALIRAIERNISPDMIEATIKGGSIERFAKHHIRFSKSYKIGTVICVGIIEKNTIKILTVERGKK